MKPKLNFQVVFVRDLATGMFTAYLTQFPGVVADGLTRDEALSNLKIAMQLVNESNEESEFIEAREDDEEVSVGSLELEFA